MGISQTRLHPSTVSAAHLCRRPITSFKHPEGVVFCCHGAAPWFPGEAWGAGQALR